MTRRPAAPRRLLLVGFSRGVLGHLEGWARPGSVVVVEEPDVFGEKVAAAGQPDHSCLGEVLQLPYQQCDAFLGPVLARHRSDPFEAVVPGVEYAVPAAATAAAATGLPGASVPAALALTDKVRLREVTTAAGMAAPAWREVRGPDDLRDFVAAGPAVVKPANRQASVGVRFVTRTDEVDSAWRALVEADEPRQLPNRPLTWRYLVERQLVGPEYSVEALVRGGEVVFRNVTAKSVTTGSVPVELGHVVPAPLDAAGRQGFVVAVEELVAAVGFDTGILHAEWIATDSGLVLVECAGRVPGDRIIELIDLAYGFRLCRSLVDLLSGRPVGPPRRPTRAAAIRFLTADPGRVTGVDGVRQVQERDDVEEVSVTVGPGHVVRPWQSSWDRIGHVVASADSPRHAAAAAERAASDIRVRTLSPALPSRIAESS